MYINLAHVHEQPVMPANTASDGNQPVLLNLMDAIIAQKQRESGDVIQVDSVRADAVKALDYYLGLPVTKYREGTYSFWRNYSVTTNKAQKALCKLARIHLTPPPTSTGKYLMISSLFLTNNVCKALQALLVDHVFVKHSNNRHYHDLNGNDGFPV